MRTLSMVLAMIFCNFLTLNAQDKSTTFDRDRALNVYLDGSYCDMDYFKTAFTAVNYVAERASADVHILITEMSTGAGGKEYTLQFVGMKRFAAIHDTVTFMVDAYATENEIRTAMLNYVQLGLVPFLMKTPAKDLMMLFIDEGDYGFAPELKSDRWKDWIFEIRAGGGLSNTKPLKSFSASGELNIFKVTPAIKFESYNSFRFSEQTYKLYDGDSLIYSSLSSQQHWSSDNLFVKSLGDHAGIGIFGSYSRDNFYNLEHEVAIGPAIEYNIYPYDEATRKQLRFAYLPYYVYSDYIDSTINNKLEDHRFIHHLSVMISYIDPSYTVDGRFTATSSLTDISQHEIGFHVNWGKSFKDKRVFFNLYAGFLYTHDQVGLKKETATMEDLLLGQCEFESDYSYNLGFSISFRFGSKNDNTVNARFNP